jgi:Fe-S-cluster formation regulator IscX/YfhJ
LPRPLATRAQNLPQGWTWELDSIEPEVGPEQSKFADVTNVVARLQQQFDLDPSA